MKNSIFRCSRVWLILCGFACPLALLPAQNQLSASEIEALRRDGFDHFYNLEYDQAQCDFERITQADPNDAGAWNHLAQVFLYREMFRIGALESQLFGHGDPFLEEPAPHADPKAMVQFLQANQRAIDLANSRIATGKSTPSTYYDGAAAWGLRGTYDFVLRKAYFAALGDALKARKLAEKALALDPKLTDAELILGAHNYVAGSLPWHVRMFASIVGYGGDKQKGIEQIRDVAAHGNGAKPDAKVLLVVIYRRQGWNRDALPILDDLQREFPRNALFAVEDAEAAEAAGLHDRALAAYRAILERARTDAPGFEKTPLDKVWYDIGNIDRLYSRFDVALDDYLMVQRTPGARARYKQAAALAAGQVEERLGHSPEARDDYNRCVQLNPRSAAGRAAQRRLNQLRG